TAGSESAGFCVTDESFPPVHIDADGLPGGLVRYGSEISSQFLSAVLMVAPYARIEVQVTLDAQGGRPRPRGGGGGQTSWPYIAMTMQLMDRFGVTPELVRDPQTGAPKKIIVPRG